MNVSAVTTTIAKEVRMPSSLNTRLLTLKSLDNLPKRLNAVNKAALMRAQQFRIKTELDPAKLAEAKKKALDTVKKAKAKAAARRPVAIARTIDQQIQSLLENRKRIMQSLQDDSRRAPAETIKSFLDRARRNRRKLTRGEMASLLIRSNHKDVDSFTNELAKIMGLRSVGDMTALNIQTRQVSPKRDGIGAVYSVRLPIKRSSVVKEIHNFAWALRKSKRFTSVRPDGSRKMMFQVELTHARRAERVFAWPLLLTRVLEAHALQPQPNGRRFGEGIVIAHPDTGWAPHPQYNENRIDMVGARRFNAGTETAGGQAARHSIRLDDLGIFGITHGTGAGSVIIGGTGIGDGSSEIPEDELVFPEVAGFRVYLGLRNPIDPNGALTGVAPMATVRPIKFIDDTWGDIDSTGLNGISVVRIFDEDLVAAINYARASGAHIVSLSIGGLMHDNVREAINLAVESNLIIVAAAGQTFTMEEFNEISQAAAGLGIPVGDTVLLPAAYANVIAVAGCSADGRPWHESLRGPNVDITAPADGLWVAEFDTERADQEGNGLPLVQAASGTSLSATFMAGVAALWLAHWGRDDLLRRYAGTPLAWVFRHQLQRTANAAHANEWDRTNYGPGVVNVRALLEEPLPNLRDVQSPPATTANVFTVASEILGIPAEGNGDVWAIINDLVNLTAGMLEAFGEAAWAAARAVAETMIGMGQQALEDLHAFADAAGGVIDQTTREALDTVSGFVEAAAEVAEDVAQAAAEAGDGAVDAVVDFAEDTVDAVGEAAEDVVDFLFGWAS